MMLLRLVIGTLVASLAVFAPLVTGADSDNVENANGSSRVRRLRSRDGMSLSSSGLGSLDRKLDAAVCPEDPDLIKGGVWYTMELDVFAMEELKCNEDEWKDMRDFLEKELDKMNLFDDFKIIDLNPNLCKDPELPPVPEYRRQRHLQESNVDQTSSNRERRTFEVVIWYDLLFKGGDKCFMCFPDDMDKNSRMLGDAHPDGDKTQEANNDVGQITESIGTKAGLDENEHHSEIDQVEEDGADNKYYDYQADEDGDYGDEDDDDDELQILYGPEDASKDDDDYDDDDDDDEDEDDLLGDNFSSGGNDRFIKFGNSTTENPSMDKRSLSTCGGCYRLVIKDDSVITMRNNIPYLSKSAFWESKHAVKIVAVALSPSCKGWRTNAMIVDTSNPGMNAHLGTPNMHCSTPGPGQGWGGAPNRPDGTRNSKFRNCYNGKYKNIITAQARGRDPVACQAPFRVVFKFRYPVTINKLGLLGVVTDRSAKIVLQFEDGAREVFWGLAGGVNSFQRMGFKGMSRVVRAGVTFFDGGGKRVYRKRRSRRYDLCAP